MVFSLIAAASALTFGAVLFKYKRKPKKSFKTLKKGDYVMFKKKYKIHHPEVPTSYALIIDDIDTVNATVIYMSVKNQVLKANIPLYMLTKAV